ncbi:aldehyde dehydrogenase [Iamia majanohamensis]|uniref:aldehyde dehydrogenase (NAD(+)) n=1 Tax=Iamia majanohamensis TaxID=467976 RepID=A0AAF0BT04_9ACTN|nr:aldehyde dehydrogenase [Iamia majanohamensis]WCO69186.1 aldehyde dehydrogenase [Iamia majanohamensis]
MPDTPAHDRLFIGGDWVAPAGTGTIEVINPSTEEVAGTVPEGTEADVDAAVAAARKAFDEGPWPHMSPKERAEVLAAASGAIQADMQGIAELISTENGCPVSWSLMGQVFAATMVADQYVGLADSYPFTDMRAGMMGPSEVRQVPIGVAAGIIPWNVPLFLSMLKLAPAMIAGCTMVLKPAPEAPLDAYVLAQVLTDAGLPPGVLNIVAAGREVSEHLVTHPDVDKVSFTGSTAAGRRIGALCGERLRPCTLELGGKSAAIILDDADLAASIPGIVPNGLMNNGQACVAQTRILASRDRYDEVVEAVTEAAGSVKVGDALDPETECGPLVAERQRDRVEGYIAAGREQGARVTVGGGRPSGMDRGWFVEPTVFADVTNDMTIAQEEIFGPVLSVIAYDDVDDAVRIANDSDYGLSGSVWGADQSAASDVARRIRTGTCNVNTFTLDMCSPFGGVKASGVGREMGPEGLAAYLEYRTIAHAAEG